MASSAFNKPTIADILRDLLTTKGISVSELARQVNVPQPTVQRIASGAHPRPHVKTLHTLANYFGVSEQQLRGFEPIPWLSTKNTQRRIREAPLLTLQEALNWPQVKPQTEESIIIDIKTSDTAYALKMPDGSMEPLIPKGSILIVDPERTPHYRSLVVVKIKNNTEAFIRQLIIDAKNCYIKPLSQEFGQFKMALLEPEDSVLGVVVEVRLHCEEV